MVEFMVETVQEFHLAIKPPTPTSGKRKSSSRLSLFHSTARKSRTSAGDLNLPTPNAVSSLTDGSSDLQDTPLRTKLEKRQHRIFEFFVTERNYVEILRYLCLNAYSQVIDENQPGGPVLPRQEADFVFGKLSAIYELHDRLQPQFTELENNWSLSESCLGNVLQLSLLSEMGRAYGNYMQFYSPPHLHHLGEQFPRFHAFMRQVEKRKESGRQSLAALLVRPVQRLPSISLLMDGIAKFTPQSHPDYNAVKEFSKGINELLAKINDRLRKNEERLSLLSLYHEISGAPPEMLSSSRSLVAKLNVFELGVSSSGNTTCEPVTLFLLSDSLEVARPRKRFTGEPLAHAIRAALAAVQGEGSEHNFDGNHDQTSVNNGDSSSNPLTNSTSSGVSVSRAGSGASGTSVVNLGLMDGKQRCCYKHLQLLKLQEIKQVVNFDTASPDRAAFGLVVRSSSEVDDRVHAYCLAASFAASAAVVNGKCPEPVESAVAAATASGHISNPVSIDSSLLNITAPNSINSHVAMLQACVGEAKRVFLHRLCHHICLVSCLGKSPEEILVDVEPEECLVLI
uniref:ECT2 protein (Epithelial cell-transforming sequence 2 oncogene) n=1 Tax=Schistosoma japonicum TaxID=6182 RepID=C1L4N9_SCHJA|nr:ECT2 protein (Epithelial cell-transforming sequence 2 oncogene) [Schistosoma japonicum]